MISIYKIAIFSLFWHVTQRWLVVADVSGKPIRPIFKCQAVRTNVNIFSAYNMIVFLLSSTNKCTILRLKLHK